MRPLTIGTRGSALALIQTEIVAATLREALPGIVIEQRVVRTEGDRRQDVSLEAFGGEGVFVKEIEGQLRSGEIDLAVHSLKDMPALLPQGLTIGAVLERGDPRDVLVGHRGRSLDQLPVGGRVGSDSRRRAVQILALRPDLEAASIRGNVDTRVAKAQSGEYAGVVLAAAGLERLGLQAVVSQTFTVDELLPAVGQAVLAVECRDDDAELLRLLRWADDPETRWAIVAERAFLRQLGAGCRLPIGAYAETEGSAIYLRGLLADDAGQIARDAVEGPVLEADALGVALAQRLAEALGMEPEA